MSMTLKFRKKPQEADLAVLGKTKYKVRRLIFSAALVFVAVFNDVIKPVMKMYLFYSYDLLIS